MEVGPAEMWTSTIVACITGAGLGALIAWLRTRAGSQLDVRRLIRSAPSSLRPFATAFLTNHELQEARDWLIRHNITTNKDRQQYADAHLSRAQQAFDEWTKQGFESNRRVAAISELLSNCRSEIIRLRQLLNRLSHNDDSAANRIFYESRDRLVEGCQLLKNWCGQNSEQAASALA